MSELEGVEDIDYQPAEGTKYKLAQQSKHYELEDCVIHDEGINGFRSNLRAPQDMPSKQPSCSSFKSSKLGSNKSIWANQKRQKEISKVDSKGVVWTLNEMREKEDDQLDKKDKSDYICICCCILAIGLLGATPALKRLAF